MLLSDALDEVMYEMYPYGFSSDKEEKSIKELALKRYKSKYEKLHSIIMINKEERESLDGQKVEQVYHIQIQELLLASYLRGIIPIAKVI